MLSARRTRQLFALHRWTGVWTGAVITFLSVTGAIVVFNPEIDEWLNPELLVTSPDAGARDVGIDTALRNARERSPDLSVDAITPPRSRTGVYAIWMTDDDGGYYQATVDPYTGEVLGRRNYKASFQDVMRQLHVRFFAFGWQGRVVVGAFGLALLISAVTGFLIYGRFIRALPRWWSIRRDRRLQISLSDWHKLIGILTLAFNLLIAVTGAVLGLENLARFAPAVSQAIHPGPSDEVLADVPETLEGTVPVSSAVARVRSVIDGFQPGFIILPKAGVGHYELFGDLPDRTEMDNASGAVVHALTGEVLYRHSAREARTITKAYNWMDPLHFGYFGGVATKVLWVLLGLASGFLSISGFVIWCLKKWRKPRRGTRGRVAPARSAQPSA